MPFRFLREINFDYFRANWNGFHGKNTFMDNISIDFTKYFSIVGNTGYICDRTLSKVLSRSPRSNLPYHLHFYSEIKSGAFCRPGQRPFIQWQKYSPAKKMFSN